MWRALLADGRTIQYDGTNSPQPFLDQIIRFELLGPNGPVVALNPDKGERIIYRRRSQGFGEWSVGHVVGLLDLESGLAFLTEYRDGCVSMGFVNPVEFTSVERA